MCIVPSMTPQDLITRTENTKDTFKVDLLLSKLGAVSQKPTLRPNESTEQL